MRNIGALPSPAGPGGLAGPQITVHLPARLPTPLTAAAAAGAIITEDMIMEDMIMEGMIVEGAVTLAARAVNSCWPSVLGFCQPRN
jgi:hypothetical protein